MLHTLRVAPDGQVTMIYSDALASLLEQGQAHTQRASHVEPDTERGGWFADMSPVGGPVLRGFDLRQQALDAERDWIEQHVLLGKGEQPDATTDITDERPAA